MLKPLRDQVAVITGASSGIGRETALRFAKQGASVAITARNEEALRQLEEQIRQQGGSVLSIPADIADWEQVRHLAQRVSVYFGRIDTWVNDAAVNVYGTFTDTSMEEFWRVIEVNLMGQVHGVKAALPYLQKEGRGAIVGVASVDAQIPMPMQSAYVASTHALKGFYDTLRLELTHERSDVQVSLIMPSSVNTPFFDHALSHLGVKPAPLPPTYEPSVVVDVILYAATHRGRSLYAGGAGTMLATSRRLLPTLTDRFLQWFGFVSQRTNEPKPASGPSNLWKPVPDPGAVRGSSPGLKFSPYTWLELHPMLAAMVVGAVFARLTFPWATRMFHGQWHLNH